MTRRYAKKLPIIWLMTDERVSDDALLAAAERLPSGGGGIVFRHYRTEPAARRALFERIAGVARRRRLVLILGGTARDAAAWRADGWHGRNARRAMRPMLHSAPAHDAREVIRAGTMQPDLIFLSPLFATRSHPGGKALGRVRFAALAVMARAPVIALGGMNKAHRRGLRGIGAYGWAAIDGLVG